MKKLLLGSTRIFRDYGEDAKGSTALTFGLALTVMLAAIGAGMDFALASHKHQQAQDFADSLGLAAAVYIKENTFTSRPASNEEGLMDGEVYKASQLGNTRFTTRDGDAEVVANYTDDNVVITVRGSLPTTLAALMGVETMDYSARSVVEYEKIAQHAASVVLVLDNSGSMAWHDKKMFRDPVTNDWVVPDDSQPRIDVLKSATQTLMDVLADIQDGALIEKQRIRTGMLPYSGNIIQNRKVDMSWGTIPDDKITAMTPKASTNSAPPVQKAAEWLAAEDDVHIAQHNSKPQKYAIFMTDGVNSAKRDWIPQDGTGLWRRYECRARWIWSYCNYYYQPSIDEPTESTSLESGEIITSHEDWEEGHLRSSTDRGTLASCNTMKADGTKVFAVGFAVSPGRYYAGYDNLWGPAPASIDHVDSKRIYSFLEECSSGPGYFMSTTDDESLNRIFAEIGEIISKQAIRVSE